MEDNKNEEKVASRDEKGKGADTNNSTFNQGENKNESEKQTDGREKQSQEHNGSNEFQQLKFEKISEIILDKNLVKKRGFLLSVVGNGESKAHLDAELLKVETQYLELLKIYLEYEKARIDNLKEMQTRNEEHLKELDGKKNSYEQRLKVEIPAEISAANIEVDNIKNEIFKTLQGIGKQKENIVEHSITALRENLKKGIQTNRDIQNEQNIELDNEFNKDRTADAEKIAFWKKILLTYQEYYDKITNRLKFLSRDGINNQTSSFLIFLGGVAALVSGWWFSLWTGQETSSVNGNTSVKFFFLDNVGKFLSYYSLVDLGLGLIIYLVSVGVLSYICYWISGRLGFIPKKKRKNKNKKNKETDDEISFDLGEDDSFLKTKFRANNWLSMWLKIAPFVLAAIPVLAIISKQVGVDIATQGQVALIGVKNVNSTTTFQSLFDSMVNQLIGSCIAISFSTFTILFFSRITENKYHEEENTKKKGNITFYFGFIIFFLMILSMFIYHTVLFNDVRTVAIIGFLVSCIATGFSFGYGYLFRSLYESSELLLDRIDTLSSSITYFSKPYRVNYTSNYLVKNRIHELQQKIFDVIEIRHKIAMAIAAGMNMKDEENEYVPHTHKKDLTSDDDHSVKSNNHSNIFVQVLQYLREKLKYERDTKKEEKKKHTITHNINNLELKYFSEKAEVLAELNENLSMQQTKLETLNLELENAWRNEGTYRSIHEQIKNKEIYILEISNNIKKVESGILVESKKISDRKIEELTLLKEGYYTGVWFRDINNNNDDKLLTV